MSEILFSEDFETRKKESVKPDYLVYKTNPLLMVRDEMAIMQARFFTAYLCKVDPENPETYKARFSLSAFCKMLDVDASNIKRLKEDCRNIRKMGFDFIEYRRKHGEKIDPMLMDEVSLFSRFTISGNNTEGYFVEVTPTEEMKHLLLNQRKYGFVSYEAKNTLVLSTKRYMRMYEFLKRSEGKGISIDITTLKAYLGLKEEDYPKMRDFKRDVLDKGIKEINEKTDILVACEPKKKGRGGKIVGFTFSVRKNRTVVVEVENQAEEEKPFVLSDDDIKDFNSYEAAESETSALPSENENLSDFDEELFSVIPEEVHEKNIACVNDIKEIARRYVPDDFHYFYELYLNDNDVPELEKLTKATQDAAQSFNDRTINAIKKFNIQVYNIRKRNTKLDPILRPQSWYIVSFEEWLKNQK